MVDAGLGGDLQRGVVPLPVRLLRQRHAGDPADAGQLRDLAERHPAWRVSRVIPNDPAHDPEVERVARVFAGGEHDDLDPDEIMDDGWPRWRTYFETAISAIAASRVLGT